MIKTVKYSKKRKIRTKMAKLNKNCKIQTVIRGVWIIQSES